ncbi:uncharacterized protein LOC117340283 [Pecten maximus]|uniref:uncharacterized protein LOC117340283 n=1 Tax=Pecten maximus TaxID=6579 RepID=UPI0014590C5E|nr:uncharacterized protein LOC117340283 [Pecten maximus]
MTGVKERTADSCVEEKQDEGKMASDKSCKSENDESVENLANNLSALTIKREPVEDNELPESLITPKSSSKGENSTVDYETKKEVKKEVVTEPCQENSALLTRGPTHGLATTNNIQHMGYNKGYGSQNAQTFKDKKRGREDDGNDPPLRYLRPGEEQFEFLTKDNSSLGMMVVKSPNKEVTDLKFPSLNQDDILDMVDQQYNPYPPNNSGQYNMSTHSYNTAVFSQNVYQSHQTVLSQSVNGNVNVVSNQQPRPNSIDQMYGRREPYTSESESESAKSPYSDQLYSPDNSSVKSINSPPPSNMSNDSGIIGDLAVNSPHDNTSPVYDSALQNTYTPWDEQNSPSQISNQSMTSPPHMSGSQGMSQAGSPRVQQAGSPLMQQAGSPLMQQAGSPLMQQTGSPMMQQAGSPLMQQAGSPLMQQAGSPMMQQTGSAMMPQAGSPMMQQTGSAMMQQTGSTLMQQSGTPMMQQAGTPMMQQAGSPMMQQAGSPMMQSGPCLAGNAMMPQQSRPLNISSSQPSVGSLGLPNIVPSQSNSGVSLTTSQQLAGQPGILNPVSIPSQSAAPLMTSQQFASHHGMVNSVAPTSHAPMISQLPGHMGMSHTRVSQPNLGSPQISQASVTMSQMMSSGPTMRQQNVQYMPSQTTAPQVSNSQLINEQIDEKELNIVMEVLADDIIESNNQKKMQKNQTSNKGMSVPSMAPPQNIVTGQHVPHVTQNRNQAPGNKPLQNIQPVPNIMTTTQNQNRIPVTLVTNNMIPMAAPMPMNSKLPITTAMTTPVLPQQPVSQAQMVLMPPGNQQAGNGIQAAGNVVQPPPMIIILNNQNMNQTARSKPQPAKALKKILPKPGTSIPDSSKPANTAPVMTRNLNEPGTRPVVPKPGQNPQTIYRQNLLNMARRTVADISRDRLRYQDDEGDTYLHVAVCKTDASMVQALIERLCREKLEVMIDATNCKRQTPLYLAVAANQPMMVHSLVARNANPCSMAQVYSNDGKTREVKTPLHVASSNGHTYLSTLQELIRSPAINLNIVNSEGHTALHCAILAHRRQNKNGQFIDSVPIIETLLKAGADPTSQDKKNGKTPLMYAIEKRDTALVERMLSMFESGEKLRNIIKFQTLDGSTCIKIAEGLKADFQPENWQRLLNTLNAALNGDPPRVMNGVM